MHAHVDPATAHIGALAAAWFGMMAAMMAPAVGPWIVAFDRMGGRGRSVWRRAAEAGAFAAGYLTAWLLYAAGAAALELLLSRTGAFDTGRGTAAPVAGALALGAAGLFQFAPLKRACLTHCRSPFGYLLTRWRDGPMGAYLMGVQHGVFCVGCCWALMLTTLAAGAASLWWMGALALVAFAEQVAPWGARLRPALGVALVAGAVMMAAR